MAQSTKAYLSCFKWEGGSEWGWGCAHVGDALSCTAEVGWESKEKAADQKMSHLAAT